jgi:hypothetical protein
MDDRSLTQALEILGEILADRNLKYELVAIGAGSMVLTGLADRATRDIDVVAIKADGIEVSAQPIPQALKEAVDDVARAMGLADDWLNTEPADLNRLGLPEGFWGRVVTRNYKGLVVHHAGRLDQIHFKLFAMVDRGGRSKHADDLKKLKPTNPELLQAARWSRTHDPSEGYRSMLVQAFEFLGVNDHGDL